MHSAALILFVYFSSVAFVLSEFGDQFDRPNLENKLLALHKVLKFVYERSWQMNVDAAFGITLVEANLAAILLGGYAENVEPTYRVTLKQLFDLAAATRRKLLKVILPENKKIALLGQILNNPQLWMRRIPWSQGKLEPVTSPSSPESSPAMAVNLIRQGRPQESESDDCIYEIVQRALDGSCRIADVCLQPVNHRQPARGYPLTHRLLFAQIAVALGCLDREKVAPIITSHYCSAILQDLVDLEAADFPDVSRDLITEQILLCGIEGYREFTGKRNEDLILSWAHPSGCFSATGTFVEHSRSRRTSVPTDFGCDSHATGLAAGALSLLLREDVENRSREFAVARSTSGSA